jgi:two-component system cell cycle sensor histidine kinase/response regulator CckA
VAAIRILVVDDDRVFLEPLSIVLRRQGYEVFSASGAWQALNIMQTEASIDLLLSDCMMPEMEGPTLVREVMRLSPRTACLLMSGGVIDTDGVPLLHKPFSTQEMISVIRRALESRLN